MNQRLRKGFTLVELMIVVAIIAILAAIAYPSYRQYVIRVNRSAMQQFMLDFAQKQQQYLMDVRAYANAGAADSNEVLDRLNMRVTESGVQKLPVEIRDYYTISIAPLINTALPTYTITATPIATSMQKDDVTLTLNQTGLKTPADKWK